jgi:hypothetical protein
MGFWSRRITNVASLMGGTAASTLLGGETDGLAIDFTDASLTVRDTTTTSNAWTQIEGGVQTFWRDRSFTSYASPSPKITRDSDGNYTYRPHNLQAMSEVFASAYWSSGGVTLAADAAAPTSGPASSYLVTGSSGAVAHRVFPAANVTVTASIPYTGSIYVKKGTQRYLALTVYGAANHWLSAVFDLDDGLTTASQTATGATSGTLLSSAKEDIGSGWFRLKVTGHTTQTGLRTIVMTANAASGNTFTTNGDITIAGTGETFYAAGAMLNAGPTALTYTKTQAHNLCLQSADFATTWGNSNSTETTNTTVAPDGTTTADTITASAGAAVHVITFSGGTAVAGVMTGSVYLKKGTHQYVNVGMTSFSTVSYAMATVDLDAGTITQTTSGGGLSSASSGITNVGNGWYRVSITGTWAGSYATSGLEIGFVGTATPTPDANGRTSYNAAGTETVIAWGAQWEVASSPGKYTATTTAGVYSAVYELPREWSDPDIVNLLQQSQTFDTSWTNISTTTNANAATSPNGDVTADRLTGSAASSGHYIFQGTSTLASAYTFSVYAKYVSNQWIALRLFDGSSSYFGSFDVQNGVVGATSSATSAVTAIGSGWYRCSITVSAVAASAASNVLVALNNADSASIVTWSPAGTEAVDIWGAQLERGVTTPSTYVPTTTVAAASAGGRAASCQGLLVEEARTNICLYARDLTQSNWTKTSATAALTATGVGGVANTASTLTASASNGTAVQNITSASAARSLSMFIKRRTGTGTVTISHGATTGAEIVANGSFTGGTSWTKSGTGTEDFTGNTFAFTGADGLLLENAATVTAGKLYYWTYTISTTVTGGYAQLYIGGVATGGQTATATYTGVTRAGSTTILVQAYGDGAIDNISVKEVAETDITNSINSSTWTRVSITNETITNPCVAIKLATSGDAIDVDYCQSEAGAFITSPIYTGSASVTRAIDNISVAQTVMPSVATTGTMYASATPRAVGATQYACAISDGGSNEMYGLRATATTATAVLLIRDGAADQASISGGTWVANSPGKHAGSWAANDAAVAFNAGAVATDATVTLPTTHTMNIGHLNGATSGNSAIRQIMALPRAMSDAELQAVTT